MSEKMMKMTTIAAEVLSYIEAVTFQRKLLPPFILSKWILIVPLLPFSCDVKNDIVYGVPNSDATENVKSFHSSSKFESEIGKSGGQIVTKRGLRLFFFWIAREVMGRLHTPDKQLPLGSSLRSLLSEVDVVTANF